MKNFLVSVGFMYLLFTIRVNANDFCSAFNLINHIQNKFNNTQNVTYLLKNTQKIAAHTVQKLYVEIKSDYASHMDKAFASINDAEKTVDNENLKIIGNLFGENVKGEFGANDLLDLCEMSQTFDEAYSKLSQSVKYVVDDMMKDLDILFNKERSDIVDKVFAENVDIIHDLKQKEPQNMHNLVNMIQFYKEFIVPDMCSFEEKSKKVLEKFKDTETLNELVLNFQNHMGNVIQEKVMPLLLNNRKWLISKVMSDDAAHMDTLYRIIDVTCKSTKLIDLCEFKANINDLISKFSPENQFILEQLIVNFYNILYREMKNFRQDFIDQNLSLLNKLDSKEPYLTHELGDLYAIWNTNSFGDVCKFQTNLNSLLKQMRTNDGRTYINQFVASLQSFLKTEAEAVFLKLELENELSLKNLLDESQQDFIHYQRLKLTIFDNFNSNSMCDLCQIVKNISKIIQKLTPENKQIVQRMIAIVYEDIYEKRIEALYQIFFGKNKEVIVKISNTQDMSTFLSIGKLFGFTLAAEELN